MLPIVIFFLFFLTASPAWGSHGTYGCPAGVGENGVFQINAMRPLICPTSNGAPSWSVNMINANLYVTDTPLWYEPDVGPAVNIRLNYNSQANPLWIGLFGRMWNFNYGYASRFATNSDEYVAWYLGPPPEVDTSLGPLLETIDRFLLAGTYVFSVATANAASAESPPIPLDWAEIHLPDSRIIEFYNSEYTEGPVVIPLMNTYSQFYGELFKIDDSHYQVRMTNGDVIDYNRYDTDMGWYLGYGAISNFSRITKITDRHGKALTIEHDGARPLRIIDAQGRQTTFTYNAQGLISRIDDPFGRFAAFEYNEDLCLTKITDMDGYWTEFEYEQYPNPYNIEAMFFKLAAMRNSQGETKFDLELGRRSFDSPLQGGINPYPAPGGEMRTNFRTTVTHPDGAKEEFYYCGKHGYGWHVAPEHYMEYVDEHRNNYASEVPKTIYNYISTAKGQREQISTIVSPEGHNTVTYYYDNATQNITTIFDGLNNRNTFTYNDKGRITKVTDPKSRVTTYTYDANDLDVVSVSSDLGRIEFEYNTNRDLTLIRDVREQTATTGDEATGLGVKETAMAYNSDGQLTSVTDPAQVLTNLNYNAESRLQNIIRDSQQVGAFTYDNIGRVSTHTDATGHVTSYAYDNLNRPTRITFADDKFIEYAYSGCCPWILNSMTDRSGHTTYYEYGLRKELIKITKPGQEILSFDYDINGNLIGLTDAKQNTTRFEYDLAGRLARKIYADDRAVSYEYDNADRVRRRINGRRIATDYSYDAMGNLVSVDYSDNTPGIELDYDTYNRLEKITDGTGNHVFAYYLNSSLKSIDGPWTDDKITYAYDRLDRVTSVSAQGAPAISYAYDTLDRLTSIISGDQTHTYTYSGVNPLVQSLTRPNGSTTDYSYNSLNQLSEIANLTEAGAVVNRYAFTHDSRDMIANETIETAQALTALAESVQTYDYNQVNQLMSKTNPEKSLVYDADGNLIQGYTPSGETFNANYDAENRLSSIEYIDSQSSQPLRLKFSYNYNDFVTRVQTYVNNAIAEDLRIIRDGYLPIQDRNGDNTVQRNYTWGLNMSGGIGGLLATTQDGQHYQYLYDGKGNVSAVLDAAAQPVASYRYDAFGKLLAKAGSLDQPFMFSTKRYFEGPGLSYYGYRFYQPVMGRWLTRDPLQEAGGINLYGFVQNNPVNMIDPLGLFSWGFGGSWGPITVSWDSSNPTKSNVSLLSDLEIGGGFSFTFDHPFPESNPPKAPFYVNAGISRWLGISTDGDKLRINIGIGVGLTPIDISKGKDFPEGNCP
jgi:RHS repeat-associated protein